MSGTILVAMALPEPRGPISAAWLRMADLPLQTGVTARRFYHPDGILVLSAVEIPEGKPEFHVSVSYRGNVATAEVMEAIRREFQMQDAQEDNHGPGVVRHLWLKVAEVDRTKDCHCVNEEAPTVDGERLWRP